MISSRPSQQPVVLVSMVCLLLNLVLESGYMPEVPQRMNSFLFVNY